MPKRKNGHKKKGSLRSEDTTLPKRALNPYQCYVRARRTGLKKEHPELTNAQLISVFIKYNIENGK